MTTILIKPRNAADHQLFVSLAKRLKAKFSEQEEDVLAELKQRGLL